MYAYKVKIHRSYIAALNGLDLLVFTGGIGENDSNMRAMICSDLQNLGIIFDFENNKDVRGEDKIISKPESKVTVMCITTDEEFVIASDTRTIVEKNTV